MTWQVLWTAPAVKDLRRLDAVNQRRVESAVGRFAATGHGDVRRLTARDAEWRLRVGDWRAIFTMDPSAGRLYVLRVRHRGGAYRD